MKYLPSIVLFAGSFCPLTPVGLAIAGLVLGFICFSTATQAKSSPLILTSYNKFYGDD
jgi:hypothetical protein